MYNELKEAIAVRENFIRDNSIEISDSGTKININLNNFVYYKKF